MAVSASERDQENILDPDKLLVLVKERPTIYNAALKDHHNQEVLNQLWKEISEEMNVPVADCKGKWHTLRTSYARHLRELKKMPCRSGVKRKKWHLADAMNFLQEYIGSHGKKTSNFIRIDKVTCTNNHDPSQTAASIKYLPINNLTTVHTRVANEHEERVFPGPELPNEHSESIPGISSRTSKDPEEIKSKKIKKLKLSEFVAEPVASYLKFLTEVNAKEKEDPMLHFFRSVLPDINTLNPQKQRRFKVSVLHLIDTLLDEQENEQETSSIHPTSS